MRRHGNKEPGSIGVVNNKKPQKNVNERRYSGSLSTFI